MAAEDYEWRLPYWIRGDAELRRLWEQGVGEYGYNEAEDYVRSTDYYAQKFEGIRRDDGSYRMEEGEYIANMESYAQSLAAVGVEPSLFQDQFISLIKGDVSGPEFWQERVSPVYDRVIDRGDEMMTRYAEDWGIEMSRPALIASLLDPEMIGNKVLNRQLGISEIRYELDEALGTQQTERYLDLTTEMYERDTTLGEAEAVFGRARTALPTLEVLARRHADPDDDFDLEEFTQATLWNDPEQARRMRRLISQEQSQFTGGAFEVSRSQTGGVSGLAVS